MSSSPPPRPVPTPLSQAPHSLLGEKALFTRRKWPTVLPMEEPGLGSWVPPTSCRLGMPSAEAPTASCESRDGVAQLGARPWLRFGRASFSSNRQQRGSHPAGPQDTMGPQGSQDSPALTSRTGHRKHTPGGLCRQKLRRQALTSPRVIVGDQRAVSNACRLHWVVPGGAGWAHRCLVHVHPPGGQINHLY